MRQNQLAKLVGINEAYLSRIINGVRVPRQQKRQEIARALGCDADWLFETVNTETGTIRTSMGIGEDLLHQ
jgi:transcriptional regulator with XRE-family HTH domain